MPSERKSDSMTNVWKDGGRVRKEGEARLEGIPGRPESRAAATYQGGFSFSKCEA